VLGRATGNTDTQDSPRPGLGGSHHLPPYSILCSSPRRLHPNGYFSRDSRVGVPKSRQMGLPGLWSPITLRADLGSRCGLKQSCSSYRELPMPSCTPESHIRKRSIPDFLWSGVKLAIRLPTLLLAIICVSDVQMSQESPF
jgi:hypothetical protein